jgi:hypothetical protein
VRIDTRDPAAWRREDGRMVCPLFASPAEQVSLVRIEAGQAVLPVDGAGAELLVLEGELADGHRRYAPGTWIRLPAGARPGFSAGAQGVCFYLKTGHLASPD